MNNAAAKERPVYTVSELTKELKALIEVKFSFIWLSGEISNLGIPSSGHCYFTLKDANAQISSVIFRNQAKNLKFRLEDGQKITGLGRLGIYEPRGTYQFIFEYIEPSGLGSIQLAFEQLKRKLESEGLFSAEHKKKIPFLPARISVITSPTGAVIRDILNIIGRRFKNIPIDIYPVKVQGKGADEEIVSGIHFLNSRKKSDVIILARGGGSLEDLAAFNSEMVARAIFESQIPIVSAIGHETDFTIADFVSDLRAPTPSAAAELVVPLKSELEKICRDLEYTVSVQMNRYLERLEQHVLQLKKRLTDPGRKIQEMHLRLDDGTFRLNKAFIQFFQNKKESLAWKNEKLSMQNPLYIIRNYKEKLKTYTHNMINANQSVLLYKTYKYEQLAAKFSALNPKAVLDRGYSITRKLPKRNVIYDSKDVTLNEELEIILSKGIITCRVEGKKDGQENI